MAQDKRAVVDPSERNTEHGGEDAVAGADERVTEAGNSVHGVVSESAEKQELEQQGTIPDPSEAAAASESIESDEREALETPTAIATPYEFRSAAASFHARSRGRKPAVLMRFAAACDGEAAGSTAPVLGASSSSAAATGTLEHVASMADDHRDSAQGDNKVLKRACSAPGASGVTVAIAHASPPDSYRRVPSRSRKQYSPKRFVAAAAAPPEAHPPPPAASLGSTALPSPSVCCSGVIDASASTSSSNRPPSRGRKQPRPEHFIPEEAEATTSAKARRSDVVLDRILSSHVFPGSSASDSRLARNITAEDAAVRNQRGGERFGIRDASRHAARGIHAALRLSRLGASCVGGPCPSASSASGSPPGEPNGRGRFYGVLAVLGASVALSVVSCVLFYVVGQRGDSAPSVQKQEK